MKIKAAIIGTGNIGSDLLIKCTRSDIIEPVVFVGRRESSDGIQKAISLGIKTLVEKMLEIFDTEHMDLAPNELLFIREKKDYLKWLAPRISSLFQEKQKIDVKSDSVVKISWESEPDLIDVSSAETLPDSVEKSDL